MTEAPPAPPPAPPKPAAPAPATTPMKDAFKRMADSSVMADPADPDPMRTVKPKPKPAEPAKPADKLPEKAPNKTVEPPVDNLEGEPPKPKPEAKPTDPPAPPKPGEETLTDDELKASRPPAQAGPWKLKKYWETRAAAAEQRLAETLKNAPDPAQFKSLSERIEAAEKRRSELEQEIVYQNYAKSEEFKTKFEQPYQEAWAKAVADLGELEVVGDDGQTTRKATANDLLVLSNMPLGEARKAAKAWFGDAADDVMAHRRRVRDLSDAQSKALTDARTKGVEHFKRQAEDAQRLQSDITAQWQKFNSEDAERHEFLKPKDGDDEWQEKLDKATSLVDKAFAENAHDPKLTADQRSAVIRRHAAVRNRAIAYSTLKLENTRLKTQLAERDTKLKEFEGSAPTNGDGGGRTGVAAKAPANPMDAAMERLKKSAVAMPNFY